MNPNQTKATAKDFFLNLGAIIALYTVIFTLLDLLFTIIDAAYPQINAYYNYSSTANISWPVSVLIIFFPILIVLMWLLEREYIAEPERKNLPLRKWLSYITLFIAGATLAGDLVTVLYYFIDGQELTTGFILKVLSVLVVSLCVFLYYISDVRDRLTSGSRKIWRVVTTLVVIGSILWGFSVLGSPFTQRQIKYDEQKVNDLQNINNQLLNYYQKNGILPSRLSDLATLQYSQIPMDSQTNQPYEYFLLNQSTKSYQVCATFNKASNDKNTPMLMKPMMYPYDGSTGNPSWTHPAGRYCFSESIPVNQYAPIPGKLPM